MHKLNFFTRDQILDIEKKYELPVYVYSEKKLLEAVSDFLNFPSAFGHTTRYAMKANSNINILKLFNNNNIKIDASSRYEVYRAINAGFTGDDIQLSSQEIPSDLDKIIDAGVFFVATSLYQLEQVGKIRPGSNIGVRINPGSGSGAFKKINTGGVTSSFGIWHDYIDDIKELAQKYNLNIVKIHIHIGSENTPESWVNSANLGLELVSKFKNVTILDMGGGFKKAIMPYEKSAPLVSIGNAVKEKFNDFYKKTGRKIHLEVEPGKYMVINSCSVIGKVIDIIDTGKDGYKFLKTNTGMTEMPRVTMYGVQQPIIVLNDNKEEYKYIVTGHCCESGDVLTTKLYDNEQLEEISLPKVNIGDTIIFEGTGAYNSSMSMKNYNSFPEAQELYINSNGNILEIRKRQDKNEVYKNEVSIF